MDSINEGFAAKVSAADVARNFGRYKEIAQRGPVAVTSHGRDSVVLISAQEFARLKALDQRQALYAHELPVEIVTALDRATPPDAAKAFDDEFDPDH